MSNGTDAASGDAPLSPQRVESTGDGNVVAAAPVKEPPSDSDFDEFERLVVRAITAARFLIVALGANKPDEELHDQLAFFNAIVEFAKFVDEYLETITAWNRVSDYVIYASTDSTNGSASDAATRWLYGLLNVSGIVNALWLKKQFSPADVDVWWRRGVSAFLRRSPENEKWPLQIARECRRAKLDWRKQTADESARRGSAQPSASEADVKAIRDMLVDLRKSLQTPPPGPAGEQASSTVANGAAVAPAADDREARSPAPPAPIDRHESMPPADVEQPDAPAAPLEQLTSPAGEGDQAPDGNGPKGKPGRRPIWKELLELDEAHPELRDAQVVNLYNQRFSRRERKATIEALREARRYKKECEQDRGG